MQDSHLLFRAEYHWPYRPIVFCTNNKKRPVDVDFIILLRTKDNKKSKWSVDLVIAPDNNHGKLVLEDAKKWMKQKYGSRKSAVIKLK